MKEKSPGTKEKQEKLVMLLQQLTEVFTKACD